jgi:hypothetical protein
MAKDKKAASKANTLETKGKPDESDSKTFARVALVTGVRHAQASSNFANRVFGNRDLLSITNATEVVTEIMKEASDGGKAQSSQMLAAQAHVLDTLFTDMAMRSRENMGEYLDASERYMRLALRAQANCRATLEALAKLHQPREQTVKHVQVNEGGQAIVADQITQQGGENGKSVKQSHATKAAGESATLLSHDSQGNGVPIASREGQEALQDARRD